jgi:hypothetical protein
MMGGGAVKELCRRFGVLATRCSLKNMALGYPTNVLLVAVGSSWLLPAVASLRQALVGRCILLCLWWAYVHCHNSVCGIVAAWCFGHRRESQPKA